MKRFRSADPTAAAAIAKADKAAGVPKDRARILAAEARRRGDLAGADRFEAMARRGSGE